MANRIGTPGDDLILLFDSDGFTGAQGGGGNDTISNFNLLFGSSPDLLGGDGNDRLLAGSSNDDMTGAAGDDTLIGALGTNSAIGGDGDDVVSGGQGNDLLEGNNGADVVGNFGDVIDIFDTSFGAGFDRTSGGAGNDTLSGGVGDTLSGGTGRDLFRLDAARVDQRLPIVTDFSPGQDRFEFLRLPTFETDVTFRIKAVEFFPQPGVFLLCQLIAQDADGGQTFLGQFGLGMRVTLTDKLGFLNNIEIVNNDDPLL